MRIGCVTLFRNSYSPACGDHLQVMPPFSAPLVKGSLHCVATTPLGPLQSSGRPPAARAADEVGRFDVLLCENVSRQRPLWQEGRLTVGKGAAVLHADGVVAVSRAGKRFGAGGEASRYVCSVKQTDSPADALCGVAAPTKGGAHLFTRMMRGELVEGCEFMLNANVAIQIERVRDLPPSAPLSLPRESIPNASPGKSREIGQKCNFRAPTLLSGTAGSSAPSPPASHKGLRSERSAPLHSLPTASHLSRCPAIVSSTPPPPPPPPPPPLPPPVADYSVSAFLALRGRLMDPSAVRSSTVGSVPAASAPPAASLSAPPTSTPHEECAAPDPSAAMFSTCIGGGGEGGGLYSFGGSLGFAALTGAGFPAVPGYGTCISRPSVDAVLHSWGASEDQSLSAFPL